jgi:glycosyltransferase involved in cell wall biosynthesis
MKTRFPASAVRRRPHILFLIDQLSSLGGAERVLLNTIRALPKDKLRCSLATLGPNPAPEVTELTCPFYVFPLRRTYDWNALVVALKLRRLIRSEQVSIVHTFFETSDLWGGLVAKVSGCPVLISSRRDMGIFRSAKHRLAYRIMDPLVDRVVAVSDQVRTFCMRQDGSPPKKVVTVYNGVDMGKVAVANGGKALRRSLGLEEESHLITTVAHVRRLKGIDVLLRAAARVRREYPRAVFLVVGHTCDQEYFRELQRLSQELGVAENVRFLGPSEQILSLLKISDIFCLLSRSEGFSNALIEAMACGLPCVATNVGGSGEAIENGVSGFLVPPEDPESAADRLLTLLRHPEKARQLGQCAENTVRQKFTAEGMINRLLEIYDSVINLDTP